MWKCLEGELEGEELPSAKRGIEDADEVGEEKAVTMLG